MQVRLRLKINTLVSVIMAVGILVILSLALSRINREDDKGKIAGEIITGAFERVSLRNDYMWNSDERAKEQWFAKNEQVGRLLKSASPKFREPKDIETLAEMLKDQGSIGKIFRTIVENREKAGSHAYSKTILSQEIENRLLSQLNMRGYDFVINGRQLQKSTLEARASAVRLAGAGVLSVFVILTVATLINSRMMDRTITERIRRLRDGALVIGSGNLDHKIDITGDDEFAELSGTVNEMTSKLGKSQNLLKEMGRIAKVGGWEFDIETLELKWTEEVYHIHEVELSYKPTVKEAIDFYAPNSRPVIAQAVQRAIELGEPWDLNLEIITAKGNHRWVQAIGKADKELGIVNGTFQDITERKHAEEMLQKAYDDLEERIQERTKELKELNDTLEQRIAERTAELRAANETLRASRAAALNLMKDALYSKKQSEETSEKLRREVAERKRAEEELQKSEEQFRTLAESISNLAWWANGDGYITWYNRRWYEYTGTTPEQMEGWGWQSVHDPNVLPKVLERWKASIATGEPFDMEFPLRGADGVFRPFLTRIMPVKDSAGLVLRWFGTNTDISELKKAEEVQGRLAAIVENAEDAIIGKDLNGIIQTWNVGAENMFGYKAEEVIGKSVSLLVPPGHSDEVPEILVRIKQGEHIEKFETVRMRKDGTIIPVSLTFSAIKDASGRIIGASKIAHDITERKRAELDLQRLAQQRQLALDAARMGWWHYDPITRISSWDDGYKEIFGVASYQQPNEEILALIHPEDLPGVWATVEAALDPVNPQPYFAEYRINLPDGSVRWIEAHGIASFEGIGEKRHATSFVGTVADITERKRAEKAIAELNRDLAARNAELVIANRELEAFSYSVAHDLRAPVRHMSSYMELLNKNLGSQTSGKAKHYMTVIAGASKKMNILIDDLLTFSRMGRTNMEKTTVNMQGIIRDVINEMAPDIKERDVEWKIGTLPDVYGDTNMLRLAIVNLISNAIKYTAPRSKAEIEIGCTEEAEEFIFFVKDNGVGFDMEFVDKLFGVFQRLHQSDEFEGTGIGLANVHRIISRHGGRTWAEGVVGQGATLYFTIPKIKEI
jgi:PAS domain S-box-containing protein